MCLESSSPSSPLSIPSKGMSDCGGRGFPKGMAKPAPLSPFDLTVKRVLSCSAPRSIVGDPVLPLDVECVWETCVYKCLQCVC